MNQIVDGVHDFVTPCPLLTTCLSEDHLYLFLVGQRERDVVLGGVGSRPQYDLFNRVRVTWDSHMASSL